MVPELQWLDEDGHGGRPAPSGKGTRFIVSHVGSRETGLVPLIGLCNAVDYNKDSDDYHKCMNAQMFQTWIRDKVLPHLAAHHPNAVLVLNQASYHRTLTAETKPVWRKMRKAEIIVYLLGLGVPDWALPPDTPMTVPDLHELCVTVVGPPVLEICRLAAAQGVTVVFLPVAHPELNPIETIWAFSKNSVRSKNGLGVDLPFTMPALQHHMDEAFALMTPALWVRAEDVCIKQEHDYLALADVEGALASDDEADADEVDGLVF